MPIITELDPAKWGQARLFSPGTWPARPKATRQILADQVVDRFHKKVAAAELNIQWIPRSPLLNLPGGETLTPEQIEQAGQWLEEAYSEIKAEAGITETPEAPE